MDDGEIIELSAQTGDWHYDRRSVTRSELIGVIRPRIEEILEDVRAKLDKAGFQNLPSRRIVLTGGASQIPGLDTLATRILGHQVRLGCPLRIRDLPQQTSGPEFSALVGVSLFAALPQGEWWDFKTSGNSHHPRSLKRIIQWVQDNW
jgi:cell division protein FtsA